MNSPERRESRRLSQRIRRQEQRQREAQEFFATMEQPSPIEKAWREFRATVSLPVDTDFTVWEGLPRTNMEK